MPTPNQLPIVKAELKEGDLIEAFAFQNGRLFACIKRRIEGHESQYVKADAMAILKSLTEDNQ